MRFRKMNGAGNDFILLNNIEERLPEAAFPRLARTLCERRLSLGADGLLVVEKAQAGGDCRMLFYNPDGSVGEMCGNGARCLCRYAYETGLSGETQRIETASGLVTGRRIDRRNYRIRLNNPSLIRLGVSLAADGILRPGGAPWTADYVELGVPGLPHAVVAMAGLARQPAEELKDLGRRIRRASVFPKGANVNFYEIAGPDEVLERTYERGVEDFTCACGTGAGALGTVLVLRGLLPGRNVKVSVPGGTLTVDVDAENGSVRNLWLTGPTNDVARGEITDDTLLPEPDAAEARSRFSAGSRPE